jgi:hypothetical protein
MQCSNCSQELLPGAEFCGNCGAKINNSATSNPAQNANVPQNDQTMSQQPVNQTSVNIPQNPPMQPNFNASQNTPNTQPQPIAAPALSPVGQNNTTAIPKQPKPGLSIASLVLGISAVLVSLFWFISIPVGVLAIILGIIGIKKGGKGMAIAGIVTGTLGVVAAAIILMIFVSIASKTSELDPCLKYSTRNERQNCRLDQKEYSTQSILNPLSNLDLNQFFNR